MADPLAPTVLPGAGYPMPGAQDPLAPTVLPGGAGAPNNALENTNFQTALGGGNAGSPMQQTQLGMQDTQLGGVQTQMGQGGGLGGMEATNLNIPAAQQTALGMDQTQGIEGTQLPRKGKGSYFVLGNFKAVPNQ